MKTIQKHRGSMLEGPLLPGVIRYTIPIILTSVLQLMFNAADLIIVGKFCGSISVGAVPVPSTMSVVKTLLSRKVSMTFSVFSLSAIAITRCKLSIVFLSSLFYSSIISSSV